ncbi:MAG: ankyrin repeat domain-containing protein [Acidobacteria bacterium]|nr:ankyrin repeat domain-containing protein [Acidobacteriota bacterium]
MAIWSGRRSASVFICYRREDSAGQAGRLFDRLAARLGRDNVFRDVDAIQPGENFVRTVSDRLAACGALVVVIGPRWLDPSDSGRTRLEDPADMVRSEIETGLKRGAKTIPALVGGARMPRPQDLPPPLVPLTELNAVELRDAHFDRDAALLVDDIAAALNPSRGKFVWIIAACLCLLAVGAAALYRWAPHAIAGAQSAPSNQTASPPLAPSLKPADNADKPAMTPEAARVRLSQLGLSFDDETLVESAGKGDATAVSLFLRAGANPDACDINCDSTAMGEAAAHGHLPIVEMLAARGASVDRALPDAADANQIGILDYLLSRKPGKEAIGRALAQAARKGHAEATARLLDAGPSPAHLATALGSACSYSRDNTVRMLLSRGAAVTQADRDGWTPLHRATGFNATPSLEIVRALVRNGANVNAASNDGTTPLMNALGHPDVVSFLLENGAAATARTKDGVTLLMLAAARDLPDMVKPLTDRGADVNLQNDHGETALMYASGAVDRVDKPETVKALLDRGARADLVDRDGSTALILAVSRQNRGAVRVLVQKGADLNQTNRNGDSALSIARRQSRTDILKILESR